MRPRNHGVQNSADAGVSFIMTEHIAARRSQAGDVWPASSGSWLRAIQKLGFKGIHHDDLYPHVVKRFGENEVGVWPSKPATTSSSFPRLLAHNAPRQPFGG
jgi:hypothetical protein